MKILFTIALCIFSLNIFSLEKNSKIYVCGHSGLVGSSIVNKLEQEGYTNIITRTSSELDLRDQYTVLKFFEDTQIDYVFLCAAKVGGILANSTYPADFLYDNLMIELNVIQSAYKTNVKKLLFLGSSCIYPRNCPQPILEKHLLTSELEKTNEAYAIAKIAGLKLCEYFNKQHGTNFISCMPTNLYGPQDNFHLENSHVIPALIKKFHQAKINKSPFVTVWGTGNPKREFLYIEDLADACLFLMDAYQSNETINLGYGKDLSIRDLAQLIKEIVGYQGEIVYDRSKPDGTPRKIMSNTKLKKLGWKPKHNLREGLSKTYEWFLANETSLRSS